MFIVFVPFFGRCNGWSVQCSVLTPGSMFQFGPRSAEKVPITTSKAHNNRGFMRTQQRPTTHPTGPNAPET